jgi:hypothetical protein
MTIHNACPVRRLLKCINHHSTEENMYNVKMSINKFSGVIILGSGEKELIWYTH